MSIHKGKPTKDGRCWYFADRKNSIEGVKQYTSKKYLTRKEAQEEEAKFLFKEELPTHKPFYIVASAFFTAMEQINKDSTMYSYINDYKRYLKPYFDSFDIKEINVSLINEWHEIMDKKGLSLSSKNKAHIVLKGILDYAMKNYGLEINYATIVGRFKQKKDKIIKNDDKIKYITFEQFEKFISVIDQPLWHCFFIFAYYTGCRKGEIIALKWEDVNFDNSIIEINKTLYTKIKGSIKTTSTKNNQNRNIKMSKVLYNELKSYKELMQKYSDFEENWYVFGATSYLPLTNIDRYKHKYFELSGVREITMHEFRHSHVSLLVNQYLKSGQTDTGKFFLMLSERMGHTIDVMQKTYLHLFPTNQNEIVNLLDNL